MYMNPPRVKIFSGTNTLDLASNISTHFGKNLGKATIQKFSDGEFQPVYDESIRGDYVFIVQSTSAPGDNLLELLICSKASYKGVTKIVDRGI